MKTRLLKNSKLAGGFGLLLALILTVCLALPAMANGITLPNYFSGNVSVCGTPVGAGVEVQAKIDGVVIETTTTDANGDYGKDPDDFFGVPGTEEDTVELWVMGQKIHEQQWESGADTVDLPVQPMLNINSTAGGEVTDPGEGDFGPYTCGDPQTLFADPDDDWHFVNWTGDVTTVDNVTAADTFITMNGIYAIVANFEEDAPPPQCELTPSSTAGGDVVTPGEEGPYSYDCDTDAAIVAVADDCYVFDGWDSNGTVADPDALSTTILMDGDYWVTAYFVKIEYELTPSSTAGGDVVTPGEEGPYTYECGDDAAIVAVADDCYEFDGWDSNGVVADPDALSTTILMDGDYWVQANFTKIEYELDTSSTAGGHVETPGELGPYTYDCGDDAPIVAVVDLVDYEFDGWDSNGVVADPDALSTTILMDGDYWVTANFVKIEYELDTSSTAGGHVETPGELGPYTYDCDTDAAIVAVVDLVDYEFNGWTSNGTVADPDALSTTILMDGDYWVQANFVPVGGGDYCYLDPSSTVGGHVETPGELGPYAYDCGDDAPIVAVADDCYEFDGWTSDGTVADPDALSTTILMDDDYWVTANFVLKEVTLSVDSTVGGLVTTPDEADSPYTYDCGDVVNLVATASGCYNFAYWEGDIDTIADFEDPTTTITMNGNYEITAVFVIAEELEDIEIPFNKGWNTFSTPISLHECVNTWGEFIAANELDINMIYAYDGAAGIWVGVDGGDVIQPLHGYYVETFAAGEAYIIPNSQKTELPSRELVRGVHLIGVAPASLESIDVVSALTTIYMAANGYEGYTLVVSPYINSPNDWEYARDGGDPPMMDIGRAYWLVMENDDDYYGSTTTPLEP